MHCLNVFCVLFFCQGMTGMGAATRALTTPADKYTNDVSIAHLGLLLEAFREISPYSHLCTASWVEVEHPL